MFPRCYMNYGYFSPFYFMVRGETPVITLRRSPFQSVLFHSILLGRTQSDVQVTE